MTTLGIIGSGQIGTAVARLAVAADIAVVIANSRGPQSLTDLVAGLGSSARAGTVDEAVAAGDFVLLSVPLNVVTKLPEDLLTGKIVLDTGNYYPSRDGRIPELDEERLTTSEFVHRHFPGTRLVKAFNSILGHHIPQLARPTGSPERSALPVAGDDAEAKAAAIGILDRLGFDSVDAGSMAESWRIEPDAAAYVHPYLADPATPQDKILQAPGAPLSSEALSQMLKAVTRVTVADRTF